MEKLNKHDIHQSIINNQKIKVFAILNKNRPHNKKLKPTIKKTQPLYNINPIAAGNSKIFS